MAVSINLIVAAEIPQPVINVWLFNICQWPVKAENVAI